MSKKRHIKNFASESQSLFDQKDFLWYFEQRTRDLVKNELEYMFQNLLYK